MSAAYIKGVDHNLTEAEVTFDKFHAVKLVNGTGWQSDMGLAKDGCQRRAWPSPLRRPSATDAATPSRRNCRKCVDVAAVLQGVVPRLLNFAGNDGSSKTYQISVFKSGLERRSRKSRAPLTGTRPCSASVRM